MTETPTPRDDYLAQRPEMDGKVVLKTTDGEEHCHIFRNDNNWEQAHFGVVFKPNDPGAPEAIVFPWTNVVHYEIYGNSSEYNAAMIKWLQDCDHEWLTHPQVGNYCKWCRLDMNTMVPLLEGKLDEPPALVITSAWVDRQATAFEGDPTEQTTVTVPKPQTSITMIVGVDPMDLCECADDSTPHEGACRMRPETWPRHEVDPDEDKNQEF